MRHIFWLLLYCSFHLSASGQSREWAVLASGQVKPDKLGSRIYFGRAMPLASANRPDAYNKQAINRNRAIIDRIIKNKAASNFITPGYRISVSNRDKTLFNFSLTDTTSFCQFIGDGDILADSCFVQWTRFQSYSFEHTTFRRYVGFDYSYFGSTNFNFSTFNEAASFQGATFGEDVIFEGVTFLGKADFVGAEFIGTSYFNGIYFNEDARFTSVIFPALANFNACTFSVNPVFTHAQLPNELAFDDVQFRYKSPLEINAKIDFSNARIDSLKKRTKKSEAKCMISLRGTDVSRLILPFDRFTIKFDAITAVDDSLLAFLLNTEKPKPTYSYEEKSSLYETLIKNCQEAGMTESVEGWDIEYREMQNTHKFGLLANPINFFNAWWWNFGYDRWRILVIWLPLFFLCFLMYNYWQIERLWSKMYRDSELGSNFKDQASSSPKPIFKNWRKRFSFSFFYTAVIYFGFKIRHDSVNYNYTRGLLYLYLMYAVGTIHMAFAFSYILSAY